MTDSTAVTNDADSASQRAAEQARLRKERREAKLRAGGSARLNKITGMSGRPQTDFDPPPSAAATPEAPTAPATTAAADPDEVDISEHFFVPKTTQRVPSSAPEPSTPEAEALRQMMLGFGPTADPSSGGQQNPFAGPPGAGDDPIMKMMSQMMGGAPGGGFPGGGFPGGGFPGMDGGVPAQQQPLDPYTYLWRLLHALVALGLGFYIVILTPFTGTKIERERAAISEIEENEHRKRLFFWVFATAEACLLTTRFFLDKGRAPPSGIIWTVSGFLPDPIKGFVQTVLRYGQIFSTVRSDILACMFVLGVCSWWRA